MTRSDLLQTHLSSGSAPGLASAATSDAANGPASSPDAGPASGPSAATEAGPAAVSPENAELTARANALALAHQAGQPGALAEVIELLRPLLRTALYRYQRGSLALPAPLDLDDLHQQSWLILDGLARRWDPAGGDFPAYVRVTFLWELWRYVRALSPSRRARTVRVDNVQDEAVLDRVDDHTGVDGRRWDDQLIAAEMLDELDPIARWVFLLHILEDRPFHDVARALKMTQAGAYRAYRRALDQLRLRAGLELDPDDALASESGGQSSIERLVTVLHESITLHGRLPGRATVCARANVSEVRFARLMGLLVTRGCIVDRSARKPGRLVHPTPEQTLAHLRRQPELPEPGHPRAPFDSADGSDDLES